MIYVKSARYNSPVWRKRGGMVVRLGRDLWTHCLDEILRLTTHTKNRDDVVQLQHRRSEILYCPQTAFDPAASMLAIIYSRLLILDALSGYTWSSGTCWGADRTQPVTFRVP